MISRESAKELRNRLKEIINPLDWCESFYGGWINKDFILFEKPGKSIVLYIQFSRPYGGDVKITYLNDYGFITIINGGHTTITIDIRTELESKVALDVIYDYILSVYEIYKKSREMNTIDFIQLIESGVRCNKINIVNNL